MTRLLLAEDNELSSNILKRRLERSGFEVLTAADGREAVALARREHPDLILMDLNMPVMDGHGAIRVLKNDPRTFRIPIIVVSSNAGAEDVARAVTAGCQAFEAKPVQFNRLLERIGEILPGAQATPDQSVPEAPEDPAPAP